MPDAVEIGRVALLTDERLEQIEQLIAEAAVNCNVQADEYGEDEEACQATKRGATISLVHTGAPELFEAFVTARDALSAETAVGAAMADAGQRLLRYIVRSHGRGAPGKEDWGDTLEAGLQASSDWTAAYKAWQALEPAERGEGR